MMRSLSPHLAFLLVHSLTLAAPLAAQPLDALVDWQQRVTLASTIAGQVSRVNVKSGQHVQKGEVLVTLDSARLQAVQKGASAQMQRVTAVHARALTELARIKDLYEQTLSSTLALDAATQAVDEAQAAMAHAEALKEDADLAVAAAALKAPFDAVVLNVQAVPGKIVSAYQENAALVVLAATDRLVAKTAVPADAHDHYPLGASVIVHGPFGEVSGVVSGVGVEPVAGGADHTPHYPIEVAFPPPQQSMVRVGYRVSLKLAD